MSIDINSLDSTKELKIVGLKGDILQISYGQNEFMVALDTINSIEIIDDVFKIENVDGNTIKHICFIDISYSTNTDYLINFSKNEKIPYEKYETILKNTYIKLKQIWFSYKKRMSVEAITGIPLDTK